MTPEIYKTIFNVMKYPINVQISSTVTPFCFVYFIVCSNQSPNQNHPFPLLAVCLMSNPVVCSAISHRLWVLLNAPSWCFSYVPGFPVSSHAFVKSDSGSNVWQEHFISGGVFFHQEVQVGLCLFCVERQSLIITA